MHWYECLCIIAWIVQVSTVQSEWTIRLMDGSRFNEGRVEIYYNDTWGTICDDGWSTEDADVVCRQLGFKRGGRVAKSGAYFGEGKGTIWLKSLECNGTESSLESCTKSDWNDSCQHFQDAGVICQPITRLIDGVTPYEGLVEIYHENQWGYLCDEDWTDSKATVVCNYLGHKGIGAVGSTRPTQVDANETIWVNDLQCMGLEYSLADCTSGSFNQTSNCDAAAYVQCTPKEPDVRLVDGIKPTEGRVEYLYNGTWGTVCEHSAWRSQNSKVVCKQLGLNPNGADAKGPAYFGEGKGPIWFSTVECTGSESSLADCPHSGWNKPDCNHTEDVAVSCFPVMKLVGGENSNEGLVQMWYKNTWTEICAGSFGQTEAEIVCHHLGYNRTGSTVIPSLKFGKPRNVVQIKDVKCMGSESMLQRCNLRLLAYRETCPTFNYAAVSCAHKSPTVRLVGGIQPYEGRIEVNYNGVWGTVCGSILNFYRRDASVVCRQLGFSGIGAEVRYDSHYGEGTGPIWLKRVDCSGTENRIEDCHLDGWGSSQFSCEHYEDVSVICQPGPAQVRLVGSKVDYEGRVEVWYNESWTGICDENWGAKEADVVCRELGFNTSVRLDHVYTTRFGELGVSRWMTNITCIGKELFLTECSEGHNTMSDSCSTPAVVFCSLDEPVIRLAGGKTFYEGQIEYRYNNTWGTVCERSWNWDSNIAKVACRQLGLPTVGAEQLDGKYPGAIATGPIWLNHVRCIGDEETLGRCPHYGWYDWDQSEQWANCDHTKDKAISCLAPVRLSGSGHSYEGLVEYYYKGEWGAVCGDGLSTSEAKVICDILGFDSSSSRMEQNSTIEQISTSNWMYNVSCSGDETRLTDCQIPLQWQQAGMCSNQALVICLDIPNEVRLVGGNSSHQGRVEYFYNDEWGTVCGDMFAYMEASVVCRQLGLNPQGARYELNAFFGEGTGQIWLDDLQCRGSEDYLANCLHRQFGVHNCKHREDVSVICIDPSPVANVSISKEQESNFIEGENATLTCTSTETYPQATITWHVNGEEVIGTTTTVKDGISSSILEFVPSRLRQNLSQMPVVSCSAFNGLGNSTSSSITLDLLYGPDSIVITPEGEQFVEEGGNSSTISCSAVCEPACIISWYRDDVKGDNLIPSSDGVLQFINVERSHSGKYHCQALNSITRKKATGFVEFNVFYGPDPIIITPGGKLFVQEGGNSSTISCSAVCEPTCIISWYRDDVKGGNLIPSSDGVLQFINVERSHTGKYHCQALNNITGKEATGFLEFKVFYGPSSVTFNPLTAKTTEIMSGSDLEVTCQSDCYPECMVQWFKDTISDKTKLLDDKILKLTSVNRESTGEYICQARHTTIDNAVMTKMFSLSVQYAPVQDTTTDNKTQLPIEVGKPAEMAFRVSSNPPPTFKWYKLLADGTEVELKDPRIKQKDTSSSSTLEINEVQTSDYGRYVVYATNDRSTYSMVYQLQSPSSSTANGDGGSSASQDLGVGAGIGIGIFVAATVVVIVIIIVCLVMKKRGRLMGVNGVSNGVYGSSFPLTDKS